MMEALLAIAGAVFTAAVSVAIGLILVRRLSVPLTRLEEFVFAFFSGSAVFSLIVFLLTAIHAAYTAVFVAAGVAALGFWFTRYRSVPVAYEKAAPLPKLWLLFAAILSLRYTLLYVSHAIGPEYSYDGSTYHLALVAAYLREHHFPLITTNMYASMPEGLEMLFLAAFSIGRHAAAATFHLLTMFALMAAFLALGTRFRIPRAAIAAAVLFYLAPIAGFDGSVAYNDVALAGACFLTFYALQLWNANGRRAGYLVLAGCIAGFAGSIKYTGFIAAVYALLFVAGQGIFAAWRSFKDRRWLALQLATVAAPALLLIAPWLIKNAIEVHNPISPFGNKIFANPFVHVSFEEGYRRAMAHLNGVKASEIPVEVTLKGARIQGLIGPVFLLAPVALFALTTPLGRQLLLAFAVFLIPYAGNIGTRFLLPALPFLSLAMALVLESWRASLVPVLLLQFIFCWPRVVWKYAPWGRGPDAPDAIRWDEAFRRMPEEMILMRRHSGYAMARYIDQLLPDSARILQFGGIPGAYVHQQMDDFYEGAQNEKATALLWSGVFPNMQPTSTHTFRFPAADLRSIRIEQTGRDKEEVWAVSEVRLFSGDLQVLPQRDWRFHSNPFPWEAGLAFDGNLLTLWKSWRHIEPGFFIEAEFPVPARIDKVEVISPPENAVGMILKGAGADGHMTMLALQSSSGTIPAPLDYRQRATTEMKKLGYTHIALSQTQPAAREMASDPAGWNVSLVTKEGDYLLFALK